MDKTNDRIAEGHIERMQWSLLIAPAIVVFVLLCVYAIKGIYPFGDDNIAYYDMAHQYIPIYYHTYDVLHGDKAAFFDWLSGCGENMVALFGTYILNPVNLFFLFVKRDMILESMSFFLLLKLVLTASFMTFYLKKSYKKLPAVYMVMFVLLYTFSGYVLQYYTNLFFLDIVMVFPLLIYGKNRLYQKKGMSFYVGVLAFCTCISVYMTTMICIYLILDAFFYALIMKSYGERGRFITELAIGTAFAMGFSAFCLLPGAYGLLTTARADMTANESYLEIIRTVIIRVQDQKYFMLYGLELPLILITGYFLSGKEKLRKFFYYVCVIVFLALPIIFEGANKMWHMGTYQMFPMRFAYILEFVVIDLAAYYVSRRKDRLFITIQNPVVKRIFLYLGIAACFFTVVVLYEFYKGFLVTGINVENNDYKFLGITFFMLFLSYGLCSFIMDKRVRNILFCFLVLAQVGIGAYGLIAPTTEDRSEPTDQGVLDALEIREAFSLDNDNLSRIKCRDATLDINYPLILGYPALSNWTGVTTGNFKKSMELMGYTVNKIRTSDVGGTVFSDALLNYKKTVASSSQSEALYQLEGTSDSFYLYNNLYTLPFGLKVPKEFCADFGADNPFVEQNSMYRNLVGGKEDLFSTYVIEDLQTTVEDKGENAVIYHMNVPVKEQIVLYAYRPYAYTYDFVFEINGEAVVIGDWGNENNIYYQTPYNNGIIMLGVFDEDVRLDVHSLFGTEPELVLGVMSLDKMKQLTDCYKDYTVSAKARGTSLTLEIEGTNGEYVFLPVAYSEGFRAFNNGKETEILPAVNGAFMAVPLEGGVNKIELSFFPPYMKWGILLSLLTLAVVILCLVFRVQATRILYNRCVQGLCSGVFMIMAAALLVIIYALPVIGGVVAYYFDLYAI